MGSNRVNRGGSWNNNPDNCRVANRNNNNPDNRNNNIGFRLARSSKQDGFLGLNRSVSCSQLLGQINEENLPVSRFILESRRILVDVK